jgi:hypothetical protein
MNNRDICNKEKAYKIYKRAGLTNCSITTEENSNVPKHILRNRNDFETKLSMALLSPRHNAFKIAKYQRILNNIDLIISNRIFRGDFHE